MAPPPRPQPEPLAPAALEFLLFLGKAEAAARGDAHCRDAGSSGILAADEDPDIVKARIRAYGDDLSARLAGWEGLSEAASERYRSRVEDLAPALDRLLERRAAAAAEAAAVGIAHGKRASAAVEAQPAAQVEAEDVNEPQSCEAAKREVFASDGLAECTSHEAASLEPSMPPKNDVELPWRRPSTRASRMAKHSDGGAAAAHARGQLEEDILGVTEGMKAHANSFLASLKRDNQTLSKISDMQDSSLDKVTKETQKGKDMLRSSQIGFLCTMVMLVTSIVIFFMLCMLIWIT